LQYKQLFLAIILSVFRRLGMISAYIKAGSVEKSPGIFQQIKNSAALRSMPRSAQQFCKADVITANV